MEWIKVCKDTPRKPKMLLLSERLGISLGDAFLNCFELWAWADSQTADGFLPGMTVESIAKLTHTPLMFCRALAAQDIAWMVQVESKGQTGIMLHEWSKHNGKCGKRRANDAHRQSSRRARKSNVTLRP